MPFKASPCCLYKYINCGWRSSVSLVQQMFHAAAALTLRFVLRTVGLFPPSFFVLGYRLLPPSLCGPASGCQTGSQRSANETPATRSEPRPGRGKDPGRPARGLPVAIIACRTSPVCREERRAWPRAFRDMVCCWSWALRRCGGPQRYC